jgi:hypothetical protein
MKVLKSRLYDLKFKEQQAALQQVSGIKKEIAFGSQIRSYVLHPYQLVKDHRTKEQVGDVNRVLDGDIDVFIKSYLMQRSSGTLGEPVATTTNEPQGARRGRPALLVAAGIFGSKIAGLVRQRAIAHYFGIETDAADAWAAGFRIPNFLQNLFGEGALSASFIPVLVAARASESREAIAGGRGGSLLAGGQRHCSLASSPHRG